MASFSWLLLCIVQLAVVFFAAAENNDSPVSTGLFLSSGVEDVNWSASYQGQKATSTYANQPSTYWKPFSKYANWITPPITSGTSATGNFTFTTTFNLNKYDPARYFLNADVASDDALVEVRVNGKTVPLVPPCTKTYQYFECVVAYKFTEYFVSGTNKLEFTVNNVGGVSNPVGLYVNFYI